MRYVIPTLCALLANAALLSAADNSPHDLAPLLIEFVQASEVPGVSAAIVRGDVVVALGSAGVRKLRDPAEFQATDSVHLGSDTKAMTALLIARLIDRQQLAFDTSMRQAFPDLAEKMNAEMAQVTVRDLLDHTAGLPLNHNYTALMRANVPLVEQRRQLAAEALAKPPDSKIGAYSYSNVGYIILGAIIESKAGQPWEEVIEREIFEPLGMSTAGFGPPGTKGKVDQPWGHVQVGQNTVPIRLDNPRVVGPAGLVHCSIGDWSKFISETMRGAQGKPRLVSAETFKQLTTPVAGHEYAGGWAVTEQPWSKGPTLVHAGSNGSWYCLACVAPQRNVAILVAFNTGLGRIAEIANEGLNKLVTEYDRIERGE